MEVKAEGSGVQGHLWLHSVFKASLGVMKPSHNLPGACLLAGFGVLDADVTHAPRDFLLPQASTGLSRLLEGGKVRDRGGWEAGGYELAGLPPQ